jgi:flagellin-specific chaperone FliS
MGDNPQDVQVSADRINRLVRIFQGVIPAISGDEAGTLAHDLSDLYDLSRAHQERVDRILQLGNVEQREELNDLLSDLLYGDLFELKYHVESLDTSLSAVVKHLDPKS